MAAMGPKFPCDVGAGIGRESYACGGCATRGRDDCSGERAVSGMTRDPPRRRGTLPSLCIVCYYRAGQSVPHARSEAAPGGAMVMQILMQWSCHGMLDSRFYCMGCKTGTYPLSKTGRATSPFTRVVR